MRYEVRIDYDRLQQDVGFTPAEISTLYERCFGKRLSAAAVYAWFSRKSMTLDRLAHLVTLVRAETDRRLDLWDYIKVVDTQARKRAA